MNTLPPLLLSARQGAVLRLTLNRPGARNALSTGLVTALADALEGAAADDSVRVVIITASGPVFSSGHDLKEMTALRADDDGGRNAYVALFNQCSAMMQQIVTLPKPVIA